jgi:Flp pilus assembly protein TadG
MKPSSDREEMRGEATVEVMLLLPLLLLVLFMMCQQTLSAHASRSADLLAERAAEIVAQPGTYGGRDFIVAANAVEVMSKEIGAQLAAPPTISIHPRSVIVTIELTRPRVLPWTERVVARTIEKPLELFIPEDQR